MNRPFVMVASVGCKEDAPSNSTFRSAEWTQVTSRKFITGKQAFRVNKKAMMVIIETAARQDNPKMKVVNAPHKPRKVEAFQKKAPLKHKR